MKAISDKRKERCQQCSGPLLLGEGKPPRRLRCFDCAKERFSKRTCIVIGDIYGTGEILPCPMMAKINGFCDQHYDMVANPWRYQMRRRRTGETLRKEDGPMGEDAFAFWVKLAMDAYGPRLGAMFVRKFPAKIPANGDTVIVDYLANSPLVEADDYLDDISIPASAGTCGRPLSITDDQWSWLLHTVQGGKCSGCGFDFDRKERHFTWDHVQAVSNGGDEDSLQNGQLLCFACNIDKRAGTMRDLFAKLVREHKMHGIGPFDATALHLEWKANRIKHGLDVEE